MQNNEYVTIPCFATPRVNLTTPADMTTQPEDTPNAYTINVDPGVEVDSFFGCWLDINQPQQKFLPLTPTAGNLDGPFSGTPHSINELITKAPHQCLIAEIRYDDAPIPLGANSADSDKLAQRNIAWIDGPNPGVAASRKMPHPFDIATSPKAAGLDQLMVMWGNVPAGSTATFYLPSLQAAEIVRLAEAIHGSKLITAVDANTVACRTGGVTFIPIPKGTSRNAGLLTIDLPEGIKRGDVDDIVVRQIFEATATVLPRNQTTQIAAPEAIVLPQARSFSWNRLRGAFQVSIVVSTKETLLLKEERLLAWLLWIKKFIPADNRWYPVFQRYVGQISGRVQGFGGDPGKILPSPTGTVPGMGHQPSPGKGAGHRREYTGKVDGVTYDRFGDFQGFILLTEHGEERVFAASEGKIEELVRVAWRERILITVFAERHDPHRPVSIVLRRA